VDSNLPGRYFFAASASAFCKSFDADVATAMPVARRIRTVGDFSPSQIG